ncbi:hypothetical protein, partial [Chryseobacterium sp. CH1]|uniref:hypothetical protein n=1 Tax=Chryseobacterium sp. CH1 TaxID=713551 RepID=UPI00102586B2
CRSFGILSCPKQRRRRRDQRSASTRRSSAKYEGNVPPPSLHLWSGFSILLLLGSVGLLVFYHARNKEEEEEISEALPHEDPLRNMK